MEKSRDLTIASDAILGAIMVLSRPDMRSELCAHLARSKQETEDVVISDEDTWSHVSGPQSIRDSHHNCGRRCQFCYVSDRRRCKYRDGHHLERTH